mgnify:CR=1 FL=1
MLLIDFNKINFDLANCRLPKLLECPDKYNIFEFIDKLKIGSQRKNPLISNPIYDTKTDLSKIFLDLKSKNTVNDLIGRFQFDYIPNIVFSTLIDLTIKSYVLQYIDILNLIFDNSGITSTIWLEDTITKIHRGFNNDQIYKSLEIYKDYFRKCKLAKLLVSSETIPYGIDYEFCKDNLQINFDEFISILPFHKRDFHNIKLIDLLHFVWNLFVVCKVPGIYLTGVNTKRSFQLFRKHNNNVSVVLLPTL